MVPGGEGGGIPGSGGWTDLAFAFFSGLAFEHQALGGVQIMLVAGSPPRQARTPTRHSTECARCIGSLPLSPKVAPTLL